MTTTELTAEEFAMSLSRAVRELPSKHLEAITGPKWLNIDSPRNLANKNEEHRLAAEFQLRMILEAELLDAIQYKDTKLRQDQSLDKSIGEIFEYAEKNKLKELKLVDTSNAPDLRQICEQRESLVYVEPILIQKNVVTLMQRELLRTYKMQVKVSAHSLNRAIKAETKAKPKVFYPPKSLKLNEKTLTYFAIFALFRLNVAALRSGLSPPAKKEQFDAVKISLANKQFKTLGQYSAKAQLLKLTEKLKATFGETGKKNLLFIDCDYTMLFTDEQEKQSFNGGSLTVWSDFLINCLNNNILPIFTTSRAHVFGTNDKITEILDPDSEIGSLFFDHIFLAGTSTKAQAINSVRSKLHQAGYDVKTGLIEDNNFEISACQYWKVFCMDIKQTYASTLDENKKLLTKLFNNTVTHLNPNTNSPSVSSSETQSVDSQSEEAPSASVGSKRRPISSFFTGHEEGQTEQKSVKLAPRGN